MILREYRIESEDNKKIAYEKKSEIEALEEGSYLKLAISIWARSRSMVLGTAIKYYHVSSCIV